ncbi:nucleotidyltransferase domain protein, partial (macronuclear) [Tetrahymena thermophila SB210]
EQIKISFIEMNIESKYYQILKELLKAAKEEDERKSDTQFAQRLNKIIAEVMKIPFHYSKNFENIIKQQVEIDCSNKSDINIFENYKSLFDKLKQVNKILTKQTAELLISTVDIIINELQMFRKKMDAPKFQVYQESVNENIKQIKLTQSQIDKQHLIDNNEQQQYQLSNYQQTSSQRINQNIQQFPNNNYLEKNQNGQSKNQNNNGNFIYPNNRQDHLNKQIQYQNQENNRNLNLRFAQNVNQFDNQQLNNYQYQEFNVQLQKQQVNSQNLPHPYHIHTNQAIQNNQQQSFQQQRYSTQQNNIFQNEQNNNFLSKNNQLSGNMINQIQPQIPTNQTIQNNQYQSFQKQKYSTQQNNIFQNEQNNSHSKNNQLSGNIINQIQPQIPTNQASQNNLYQNFQQQNYKSQQNNFIQNEQNSNTLSKNNQLSSNMLNQIKPTNNFNQDLDQTIREQESLIFQVKPEKQAISKIRMQGLQEADQKIFDSMIDGQATHKYNPKIIIANLDYILVDSDEILRVQQNSDQIDFQMYEIYKQRILEQKKKKDMITMLNYVLNVIYRSAANKFSDKVVLKAYLFGSFLQGTSLKNNSDIDVILEFENIEIKYRSILYFISSVVKTKLSDEFEIETVINQYIRIPFINLTHKKTGYKIDIIYENKLGILNSHLFYTYLNIHIKIKVLSVLFKIWADNAKIKDKYKLTSYALLNIVIYYFITNGYIWSIQDYQYFQFTPLFTMISTYCNLQNVKLKTYTSFESNKQKIKQKLIEDKYYQKLEQTPLHKLFVDLIEFCQTILYMNSKNNEDKIIITIRPNILKIRGDLNKYKNGDKHISIQDPFDDDYNPGQRKSFNYNDFVKALNKVPNEIRNIQQLQQLFQ